MRGFVHLPMPVEDDLARLWHACHEYLTAQGAVGVGQARVAELSACYDRLVSAHNDIHAKYFAEDDNPLTVAGT